jgi:hypothetical protein
MISPRCIPFWREKAAERLQATNLRSNAMVLGVDRPSHQSIGGL